MFSKIKTQYWVILVTLVIFPEHFWPWFLEVKWFLLFLKKNNTVHSPKHTLAEVPFQVCFEQAKHFESNFSNKKVNEMWHSLKENSNLKFLRFIASASFKKEFEAEGLGIMVVM
jgi:hypothetical protein